MGPDHGGQRQISLSGAQARHTRYAKGGRRLNVNLADAGFQGSTNNHAYAASKGAVRLLTKSAALRYGSDNIRCNAVYPAAVQTMKMPERFNAPLNDIPWVLRLSRGRWQEPEEVAYAVLYLASDESSFVTGSDLVADVGSTAGYRYEPPDESNA